MKKITKWGAGLVLTLSIMFMAGQAYAITLGLYEKGVLVPLVTHNGSNIDTVVGLTSLENATVYWTFFDNNSRHIQDGLFDVTANDMYSFSWKDECGIGLEDVDGYLIFTIDGDGIISAGADDNDSLTGNAFMLDTSTDDAIFVPVVPLDRHDYADGTNITPMNNDSITSLIYGTWEGTTVDIRYWIDPAYGASTNIVIWTVADISGSHGISIYNDDEVRYSWILVLENETLNVINAKDFASVPPINFIDGFIRWQFRDVDGLGPSGEDGIAYSYISSTHFGVRQTLLAAQPGLHWEP